MRSDSLCFLFRGQVCYPTPRCTAAHERMCLSIFMLDGQMIDVFGFFLTSIMSLLFFFLRLHEIFYPFFIQIQIALRITR